MESNTYVWWHSPEMVAGLWAVIVILLGWIATLFRSLRRNTEAIAELKQWKNDLGNGITLHEVKLMYEWWAANIVKRPLPESNEERK